jgi:hypothetical protein
MKTNYIFISKNNIQEDCNTDIDRASDIKKMLKLLFEFTSSKKIKVIDNDKEIIMDCYHFREEKDSVYFSIECEASSSISASALSLVRSKIIKGVHRNKYNIVVAYDDASNHYCTTLNRYFNRFERVIRQLIFYVLIEALGSKWCDTISKELESALKAKKISKSKFIEEALYELTNYQLEGFLFDETRKVSAEKAIDDILNDNNLNDMTKEEIIEKLEKSKPQTLWDRLFLGNVKIENLKENLIEIRGYRNIIAHNKLMFKEDFKYSRKIIKKMTKEIDFAVNQFEIENISEIDIANILSSFGKITSTVTIHNEVLKSLSDATRILASISVPKLNVPNINIPTVNIPKVNIPKVNVPKVNIPTVNVPTTNIPKVNIPTVNIPNINLLTSALNALSFTPLSKEVIEALRIGNEISESILVDSIRDYCVRNVCEFDQVPDLRINRFKKKHLNLNKL